MFVQPSNIKLNINPYLEWREDWCAWLNSEILNLPVSHCMPECSCKQANLKWVRVVSESSESSRLTYRNSRDWTNSASPKTLQLPVPTDLQTSVQQRLLEQDVWSNMVIEKKQKTQEIRELDRKDWLNLKQNPTYLNTKSVYFGHWIPLLQVGQLIKTR